MNPGKRDTATQLPVSSEMVDWLGSPSDSTVLYFNNIFSSDSTSKNDDPEFARSLTSFISWTMYHLREPVFSVRSLDVPVFRVVVFQGRGRLLIVRAAKLEDSVEIISKTDVNGGLGVIPTSDSVRIFHYSSAVWDTLTWLADSCSFWSPSAHEQIHPFDWRTVWIMEAQNKGTYSFHCADYPIANQDKRRFSLVCLYLLSLGDIHARPWESFHFDPREAYDWIKDGSTSH